MAGHAARARPDLILLPEMPFHPWLAVRRAPSDDAWADAVAAHARGVERLGELAPAAAVLTQPVLAGGRRLNRAVWHDPATMDAGAAAPLHDKYYLPDEPFFWEASWYERGDGRFDTAPVRGARVGVQICTEMWFMERGRAYGRAGAQLILVPRATPHESLERWLTGARTLAMIAGAYVVSSNDHAPPGAAANLGGMGFCVDPDGQVLATTSAAVPFVSLDLDLTAADAAKAHYPRYVAE